jgi:uncharacterized coiled-coil DUF342 family protein
MTEDNVADPNSALLQKIARELGQLHRELHEFREEARNTFATKDEMRDLRAEMRRGFTAIGREVDGLRTRAESHDEALRELRDQMRDRRRPHAPTRPKRP